MIKDLGDLMKQAHKMKERMAELQEELSNRTIEATAGGGMVKVVANGKQEIISIKIEPEVVKSGDVEMLEDLIIAGVNEAIRRVQEMAKEEMSKLTGGINIPGLF
ncbi:MAG TPA: YbaB/EbfC family nucleoid-associated protein [Nitrospinota bacterium]|nr:YbaB/EbfC family nucleoid-associated protein [Nitrospinota bacterium]